MKSKVQPRARKDRRSYATTLGALFCAASFNVYAVTYTNIHNFNGYTGSIGARYHSLISTSALAQGSDGNLYGTAQSDQSSPTCGTIFRITPKGHFTKLHDFTHINGCNPQGGLVRGNDGAFYGATYRGGSYDTGVIFRVTRSGTVTTLAHFRSAYDSANVGVLEKSRLTLGSDGNFYGVARRGGNGHGTVFKVTPSGRLVSVKKFNYTDGSQPDGPLLRGGDGNLYGSTPFGGKYHQGVAFKITRAGSFSVLHHFGATTNSPRNPAGAMAQLGDGNFYGVTTNGGSNAAGTVYKMTPRGAVTRLYNFDSSSTGRGAYPYSGLIEGRDGKLYGATSSGGAAINPCDCGVLFKITRSGAYSVLSAFDGTRGQFPYHALPMQHSNNSLYGIAAGGAKDLGVIYKLTP